MNNCSCYCHCQARDNQTYFDHKHSDSCEHCQPEQEDWEKEFDKQFNFLGTYNQDELGKLTVNALKYLELKDFIRKWLQKKYDDGYADAFTIAHQTAIETVLEWEEGEQCPICGHDHYDTYPENNKARKKLTEK